MRLMKFGAQRTLGNIWSSETFYETPLQNKCIFLMYVKCLERDNIK